MSVPVHRIFIEPVRCGNPQDFNCGHAYRVRDETGAVILDRSRVPLYDAARVYAGRGFTGQLVMARYPSGSPCMEGDISKLSTKTVTENADCGPVVRTFKKFPEGDAA